MQIDKNWPWTSFSLLSLSFSLFFCLFFAFSLLFSLFLSFSLLFSLFLNFLSLFLWFPFVGAHLRSFSGHFFHRLGCFPGTTLTNTNSSCFVRSSEENFCRLKYLALIVKVRANKRGDTCPGSTFSSVAGDTDSGICCYRMQIEFVHWRQKNE